MASRVPLGPGCTTGCTGSCRPPSPTGRGSPRCSTWETQRADHLPAARGGSLKDPNKKKTGKQKTRLINRQVRMQHCCWPKNLKMGRLRLALCHYELVLGRRTCRRHHCGERGREEGKRSRGEIQSSFRKEGLEKQSYIYCA